MCWPGTEKNGFKGTRSGSRETAGKKQKHTHTQKIKQLRVEK